MTTTWGILLLFWAIVLPAALYFFLHRKNRATGYFCLEKIKSDIWCYRGYFSNSAIVKFKDCLVLVDTQVSPKAARKMLNSLRKQTNLPIKYVVNTHHHGDHVGGNEVFSDARIIGTDLTKEYVHTRDDHRVNYTKAFGLLVQKFHEVMPPNETFSGEKKLEIDEEEVHIAQMGSGETEDACVVHFPKRKLVVVGDAVAPEDFPFLGTPFLDEGLQADGEWVKLLTKIRELKPGIMICGHGPVLVGEKKIYDRLTLLINLYTDLIEETRKALEQTGELGQILPIVRKKLSYYKNHPDLKQKTLSIDFAIYRSYNSLRPERKGKGWWYDLRPSVVKPSDEIEELKQDQSSLGFSKLSHHYFKEMFKVPVRVDSSEYAILAADSARKALEKDEQDPVALSVYGILEVLGGLVLAQELREPIGKLELALEKNKGRLGFVQKALTALFLSRAYLYEENYPKSFQAFTKVLPSCSGILLAPFYPIVKVVL